MARYTDSGVHSMRRAVAWIVLLIASVAVVEVVRPDAVAQIPPLHLASATCPAAGVTLTTTTEGSAVTSGGISTSPGQTVRVLGTAIITTGTGTTTVTLRIRRGSGIAGTNVGTPTAATVTAGNTVTLTFGGEDSPGEVAGQQYSLTAQQAGATANGTVASCELWVQAY